MQIAPDVDASLWQGLKLDDPNSSDWDKAVGILAASIRERYTEPVDFLIAAEETKPATERRFGFTVLAIDCLLVETLGAFIEGLEETDPASPSQPNRNARRAPKFAFHPFRIAANSMPPSPGFVGPGRSFSFRLSHERTNAVLVSQH